jgi:hypothetical protein
MSEYSIDVQVGLALSASWRHPEMLQSKITDQISRVKQTVR